MRQTFTGQVIAAATLLAAIFVATPVFAGKAADVERGRYLITIGQCNDCHSPKLYKDGVPEPDPSRLLSGHPAGATLPAYDPAMVAPGGWVLFNEHFTACVGPWGTTYAANLTPDKETGIGLWSVDHFIGAMRTGKHMGAGRPIMPPMPWPNIRNATDEDLKAMFAYLQSLPPVRNPVPAPTPPEQVGLH